MAKCWYVYLIECTDGSLYTGICIDPERRYAQHASGKGARYTRSHPPARFAALLQFPDRSSAGVAEYRIKQLPVAAKRELCLAHPPSMLSASAPAPGSVKTV